MEIKESVPVGMKVTMRIGETFKYYGDVVTKEDIEQAWTFSQEKGIPLIVLGGGSNTIFDNTEINALVVRIKTDTMQVEGNRVTVASGKILASLINDLAKHNLDLSPLTGIPGTIGGAVFGNAGQGPKGLWLDHYIETVTVFVDGEWKTLTKDECNFRYRESAFKDMTSTPIIWETVLNVPTKPEAEVKEEVERLLKVRIETQPHLKTAGSCFKALPDGTPAWTLIDKAGLRGFQIGGVQVSEKHANFLLNVKDGTFADAVAVTKTIREKVPEIAGIEMRFFGQDGNVMNN